jgi:mannose-6-phosphate isomerase-like protein (cupin superfamily)
MTDTTFSGILVNVFAQDLRLQSRGTICAEERRMADVDADWRLAMFHVETAHDVHADRWEKHPLADEVVCCLRGAMRLCLRATQPGTPDEVVRLAPGRAVIVPRDRWHRFELEEPTDILAVTLRRGTQLEARTTLTDGATAPRDEAPFAGRSQQ